MPYKPMDPEWLNKHIKRTQMYTLYFNDGHIEAYKNGEHINRILMLKAIGLQHTIAKYSYTDHDDVEHIWNTVDGIQPLQKTAYTPPAQPSFSSILNEYIVWKDGYIEEFTRRSDYYKRLFYLEKTGRGDQLEKNEQRKRIEINLYKAMKTKKL